MKIIFNGFASFLELVQEPQIVQSVLPHTQRRSITTCLHLQVSSLTRKYFHVLVQTTQGVHTK